MSANESDNGMPGYWNHVSIFVGGGIIEAQMSPWNTIKLSDIDEFWNRYPKILQLRWKDTEIAKKAAIKARTMIGKSYAMLASIFFRLRRGENCVTVVRKSFGDALGYDPGWRIPDDFVTDDNFTLIDEKR